MPNSAPADHTKAPGRTSGARGLSVDELAARRNSPPLPPEPVFTIDLVEAETEPAKRGRRYVAELEERAQRNALAAAEARAIALEQRRHLEEAADGRRRAERQIAQLNRELRTAVAEQRRLELRNRTQLPPADPSPDPEARQGMSELAGLRDAVEQQERLLGEGRERLASALRERDAARIEARQAAEARDRAKRSLDRATELLQDHAIATSEGQSPASVDGGTEAETAAELRAARMAVEARLVRLSEELARLTEHAEELEARVATETVRADRAEDQVRDLTEDAAERDGRAAAASDEAAAAVAREASQRDALALLTARVGELEAQLAVEVGDHQEATRLLDEVRTEAATVARERDEAIAAATHFEECASRHAAELEQSDRSVTQLREQLAGLSSNVGTTTAALAEADQLAADRARAVAESQEAVAGLRTELTETVSRLDEIVAERDDARTRLDELHAALKSVETLATERSLALREVEQDASGLRERADELGARLAAAEAARDEARATVSALEQSTATATAERDGATRAAEAHMVRARELEHRLSVAADEVEKARARTVELNKVATARDAALADADRKITGLTHQLAELEALVATTTASREDAERQARELEQRAARVSAEHDDETASRIADLEASLARAREDAAAYDQELARLTRAASDAEVARAAAETSAAADRRAAQAQVDRLGDRIIELEELIRTRAPQVVAPAPALEEIHQLAEPAPPPVAPVPAPARTDSPAGSDLLRALRSELSDVNTVERAESRRSLLADLSDLADANDPPT